MRQSLTVNNDAVIIERRRHKRCPKCQLLIVLAIVLSGSFAVLFLFNVFPLLTDKGDFQVLSASSYEFKNSIAIDADLKMHFPDPVVDALENGIPLTIVVEVQVFRERPWWRNFLIKRSTQLFELRYHPLTNVHEVKNIATDERYSFNSRQDAMAVLGTIRGAFLIENKQLNKNKQYSAQIRILLDISHLPPALRQVASLSSSWRLESAWYQWQISNKPKAREQMTDNLDLVPVLNKHNAVSERILNNVPVTEVKEQSE
jgi:hypothetical protein